MHPDRHPDPQDSHALLALFDDLEQQAEGLALAARDEEVADLARDAYVEVDLAARLHASTGHEVSLRLRGAAEGRGTVLRTGADWCLLERPVGPPLLVHLRHVLLARGLSADAVPAPARSVLTRLGLRSCLRGLAADGSRQVLALEDGGVCRAAVRRVGADFVEVDGEDGPLVVPLAALVSVTGATSG